MHLANGVLESLNRLESEPPRCFTALEWRLRRIHRRLESARLWFYIYYLTPGMTCRACSIREDNARTSSRGLPESIHLTARQ